MSRDARRSHTAIHFEAPNSLMPLAWSGRIPVCDRGGCANRQSRWTRDCPRYSCNASFAAWNAAATLHR